MIQPDRLSNRMVPSPHVSPPPLWTAIARLECLNDVRSASEWAGANNADLAAMVDQMFVGGWIHERRFPLRLVPAAHRTTVLRQRLKDRARHQLKLAVRDGRITKPDHCPKCGEEKGASYIHGHHDDYEKPLDVEWMCDRCHRLWHGASK